MREYTAFWPFLVLLFFMAFFLVENLVELENRRIADAVIMSQYDSRVKTVQKEQDLFVSLGQELLAKASTNRYAAKISSEFRLQETVPNMAASQSSPGTGKLAPSAQVPDADRPGTLPAPTEVPTTDKIDNTPLEVPNAGQTGKGSLDVPDATKTRDVPEPGKATKPRELPEPGH